MGGSCHDFPSTSFVSQCRNFSWRNLLCCVSENCSCRKILWIGGGGGGESVKFFRRNFSDSQCRKTSLRNPSVFQYFRVSKNVRDKKSGRVSRVSVEIVLSHATENNCTGTLLCFKKFLVPKKIMDKKGSGRKEYHGF